MKNMTNSQLTLYPCAPLLKAGALLLVATLGLMLPACSPDQPQATNPTASYQPPKTPEREVAGKAVAVEDVNQGIDSYLGKTVTVSGQVGQVFDAKTFSIQSDANLSPSKPFLVVVPPSINRVTPKTGQYVQLIGEVQAFVPSALEEKYDYKPDEATRSALVAQFNMQPVVVAKER